VARSGGGKVNRFYPADGCQTAVAGFVQRFLNTLNLLNAMRRHQVSHLIFSSTAAVFGNPNYTPIDEQHPTAPINPYGVSKWMVERILQDYANAYGLNSVALRYFNACGADPDVQLG
jgi:UDP-glucose 4-epimerase